MTDYSENGESPVSDSSHREEELFEAVREAIEDWVVEESIAIEREKGDIVADEDELVENISIMVAIAVDEASIGIRKRIHTIDLLLSGSCQKHRANSASRFIGTH